MAESTKNRAEDYSGYLSPTQAALYGAGKEAVQGTVAQKQKIAETAGKSAGIIRDASARQAEAAKRAGQTMTDAYGEASRAAGQAYDTASGMAGTAYGEARSGLQGAYGQAQQATASRHRNALMAARMELANQAMRTLQRDRSTLGNLQATGTMGKQSAATRGLMASQMAQEQSDLALGQAREMGGLGLQESQTLGQLGIQQAGQQSQYGIGAATSQAQAGQAAAGFEAAGAKEAQAATLMAEDATYNAIMAEAEALGLDFFMNEQQLASYTTKQSQALSDISIAQEKSADDGITQAQVYLSGLDLDNPADRNLFKQVFNQAMIGIDGMAPGTGTWSTDDAIALAQALGDPQAALEVFSGLGTLITSYAMADGSGALPLDKNHIQGFLQRVIETGGVDNLGVLYRDPQTGELNWADSEEDVPANEMGVKAIYTQQGA